MKKIYYFPGLISAALIPLLFWYYGNQKIQEPKTNIMDILLPAKIKNGEKDNNFSFEPLRNWNYKQIKIAPNTAKENSKFYVSEIKNLQKINEKETGIEFILDSKNTYGDFASLLNDMAIAKQETYTLDLNKTGHVFAITEYKNPDLKKEEIECLLCHDHIIITDGGAYSDGIYFHFNLYDESTAFFSQLPKQSFYIIFGFLLFLNISMFSIKERFQLQKMKY